MIIQDRIMMAVNEMPKETKTSSEKVNKMFKE